MLDPWRLEAGGGGGGGGSQSDFLWLRQACRAARGFSRSLVNNGGSFAH